MAVWHLINTSESGTKQSNHFETSLRVSEGGQHVEVLLVNADGVGSTGHSLAFVGADVPRAPNSTAGPRSNGRDHKPRSSPADAQREIKSHRASKGKTEADLIGSGATTEGTPRRSFSSPEQKSAKKKIVRELTHDQMNSVLTPEQQDKFKQMKQDAMEKHQEMNH